MPAPLLVYTLPPAVLPAPTAPLAPPDATLLAALSALGAVLRPWPAVAHEMHQLGADAPEQVVVLGAADALCAVWPEAAGPLPCALTLLGPLPSGDDLDAVVARGLAGWWPASVAASPEALAAVLALDLARWRREAGVRTELARLHSQLDERKWVDRAKGVLMSARGIGEDEAFRLLRGASMHTQLRVGEVSRSVIEAAQWADAVNRAGQLRMLSQRLVKLAVQRLAGGGADTRRARELLDEALLRTQNNLDRLAAVLPGSGPAVAASQALVPVQQAWTALRTDLQAALTSRRGVLMMAAVDVRADALLAAAEALTAALEAAGARRALHIVNLCGRQRMRVQRVAKDALLASLLNEPARRENIGPLVDAFEATLQELAHAPLSSDEIRAGLAQAGEQWLRLLRGLRGDDDVASRALLAGASDALLDVFDRLTAAYEHSLQMILS